MPFFRRRTQLRLDSEPYPVRALLDLGASGARAVVARLVEGRTEILGMAEIKGYSGIVRPGQVVRREQMGELVEKALTIAEQDTIRDGALPYIADDAIVGLTGPFLESERYSARLHRYDPIAPIYEAEVLDIFEAIQERNLSTLHERLQQLKVRRTLISSQLIGSMSVREDTRELQRLPDDFRGLPTLSGDLIAIAVCNLTWPSQGFDLIDQMLKDLELRLLGAVPLAQATALALPVPNAILIDVGYEYTEISLVEGAVLSHLAHLPRGGQFFTEQLMQKWHLTAQHAELIKQEHVHSQGHSGGRPVTRVLRQAITDWLHQVEQLLLKLAGDAPLPSHLYLFGGGSLLPEILDILRSQPWSRRLPFERDPTIERLTPHRLRGIDDPRGLLSTPAHVGIAALATWASREVSVLQTHFDNITDRLISKFGFFDN